MVPKINLFCKLGESARNPFDRQKTTERCDKTM